MSKELEFENGDVVDAAVDEGPVCPACNTPRHSERYADQWLVDEDAGIATCPTCGTDVEDL